MNITHNKMNLTQTELKGVTSTQIRLLKWIENVGLCQIKDNKITDCSINNVKIAPFSISTLNKLIDLGCLSGTRNTYGTTTKGSAFASELNSEYNNLRPTTTMKKLIWFIDQKSIVCDHQFDIPDFPFSKSTLLKLLNEGYVENNNGSIDLTNKGAWIAFRIELSKGRSVQKSEITLKMRELLNWIHAVGDWCCLTENHKICDTDKWRISEHRKSTLIKLIDIQLVYEELRRPGYFNLTTKGLALVMGRTLAGNPPPSA